MSWISLLTKTYDNLIKADDVSGLRPISHSTQKAHVEITVDINGDFVNADYVVDVAGKEKNLSETLIPVTENSGSRGGGVNPHPLCDKLQYLALDYPQYCDGENLKYYTEYMSQLEKWVDSEYSNEKVRAIYSYIKKGNLISDLVKHQIFSVDESNKLTNNWNNCNCKLTTGSQSDAFIRFRVITSDNVSAVWQDKKLQQDFANYYFSAMENKDFCYASGENKVCTTNHPSKIRHSGDRAKLISANDPNGFTYRGRFALPGEAVKIGYDVSQKAHNALKYLISKQATRIGGKVFVLWGTKNEDTPHIDGDTVDFFSEDKTEDLSEYSGTKQDCAMRFNKAINGYKANIKFDTELALMGIDAATKGRMSIVYYREYFGKMGYDLLDNIEKWHKTCEWQHLYKFKNKKIMPFFGAPSPYDIATCAYGTEQGEFIKGDDVIVASAVEKLFSSITDGAKISRDIVNLLVRKCYSPQNYAKSYNWQKVLSVTCSMYKKYLYDYCNYDEREFVKMEMQDDYQNIDYSCGRLLAVADAIEKYALKLGEGGSDVRPTNAMRYFSKFSRTPCETWAVINDKLYVYKNKLGNKGNYLTSLLSEISANINQEDFYNAKNLDGRMALGFDSQRKMIFDNIMKKSANKNITINENNNNNEEE